MVFSDEWNVEGDERLDLFVQSSLDQQYMAEALSLAAQAEALNEVPVGAVLVSHGRILGRGFNRPILTNDPTSHAEVEALRQACHSANNYRLPDSTLYVTLEPCLMCAGVILIARVRRLVFGARDLRFGAVRSKFQVADSDLLNHQVSITEGVLAAESAELMMKFFARRRNVPPNKEPGLS